MRILSGLFGILGALGGLFLGFRWYSDLNSEAGRQAIELLGNSGPLAGLQSATYALLICGVVGLIASAMVIIGKGPKAILGITLIVAGVLPLVFATKAMFGVPMVLAGLMAFGVKEEAA